VDWIHLTYDTDQWQAVVNKITFASYKGGEFLDQLSSYLPSKDVYAMELFS
jgi:hypothetical protein